MPAELSEHLSFSTKLAKKMPFYLKCMKNRFFRPEICPAKKCRKNGVSGIFCHTIVSNLVFSVINRTQNTIKS